MLIISLFVLKEISNHGLEKWRSVDTYKGNTKNILWYSSSFRVVVVFSFFGSFL